MKIVIASDHAGFTLKNSLVSALAQYDSTIEIVDMGASVYDEHDDYPDFICKVGEYISQNSDSDQFRGIVIGGSGQGENMCANKYTNVRSMLIYGNDTDLNTNIAILSRQHNDSNVISFGARFIEEGNAFVVLKAWLEEKFSHEERHIRRLAKIEHK